MRLFSNRSQRTSKCDKNISDTFGYCSYADRPSFCSRCEYFLLNCRWWPPSITFLVLLPLSAIQTKTSLPVSASFWSSKSPQHSFRLSPLARKPKWREKNHHNVHWSASGLWQPNSPLSNNFSSSSVLNSRHAFRLFPRPFFYEIFSLGCQHFPGTTKFFILEDIEGQL